MGGCCPDRDDPDAFQRKLGLLALICLVAMIGFFGLSWALAPSRLHHAAKIRRYHLPASAEEHESVPMPRGHLDRG